ncbi:MAG TPA: Hsp20/alpha crystallin family protein [Candidatus Woesearchaeota archaeon]|nr:Hsp20/alpha crystallin family protein [Candidatus Woesearchaeota archaeon]
MEKMQEEMNQMFEKMSKHMPSTDFRDSRVDVSIENEDVVITAEMPGVNKDEIDLVVTENDVTIKAERKDIVEDKDKEGFYRHERSYKGYNIYRSFPFEVRPETAEADYEDGLLTVRIEKVEKEKEKEKKKVKVR